PLWPVRHYPHLWISARGLGLSGTSTHLNALAVRHTLRVQRTGVTWVGPPLDPPFDEAKYRRVFAALAQEGAEGIIVTDDAENVTNLRLIIALAEKGRLPAMYPYREFVETGGLISYVVDLRELGRRAAEMVDRILNGRNRATFLSSSRSNSS